ncbi:DUF7529 family protein [Halobacterium zhouii]|uniref:DUF7529 family protein n=1 Tax=Halobacterium zhouii TaxID=2902624 RepID=UPI001E54B037|nr:hypothetical protein [Halobacterium zhouii]
MPEKRITDDDDELLGEEDQFEEQTERLEREAEKADDKKQAWEATLNDMEALADEYEDEGWDVLTIAAGDTAAIGRDTQDDEGEFGLSYVVGADDGATFEEMLEEGEFPVYDVYRQTQLGHVFMVTELRDPDTEQAIFIAGAYLQHDGQMCAYTAREEGEMYTHVKKLDGTVLGRIHHDGYEKFFPEADRMPDPEGWLDE